MLLTQITHFYGEYDFLSNFYLCPIELDGVDYPSVEHAFQAAKTFDADERYSIQIAHSPAEAKRLGRRIQLREDWESVKLSILENMVRQKFTRHPELGAMLLTTGDAELIEGNDWNDRVYGAVWNGTNWVGKNHLGRILTSVRDELRRQSE
jgi:N-glycosidase YbiA